MCSHSKTALRFADVVLPLAVPQQYTYQLADAISEQARVGMRAVVQLGARKLYTGIIANIHQDKPGYPTKPISELLDDLPSITPLQLTFWQWLASYYMCNLGEVMIAALPNGMKLASESKITRATQDYNWHALPENARIILEALENCEHLSIQQVGKILEVQNPLRIVHRLLDAGLIALDEEMRKRSKPKSTRALALPAAQSEEELNTIFESLRRSPKQAEIMLAYLRLKEDFDGPWIPEDRVLKEARASAASLKSLLKKGHVLRTELQAPPEPTHVVPNLSLSDSQWAALTQIEGFFEEKKPVLLHGVTSSGKTEIYITLIKKALEKHKRALYLVPEIALTTQLINRLRFHFGGQAVVYHSRLSQGERLAAYQRLLHDAEPLVLLGARSALLLPLPDLGIVVVDEEHDASFKQQDPAPRYHARDAALVLAKLAKCPVLLGSATPSVESYYHTQHGSFGLVELTERFGGVHMPEMEVVDIRKETLWKTMAGHYSRKLLDEIKETLARGKRVILFQNRRGHTPVIQCRSCGHIQKCVNCDITLTYHKYSNQLKCHYCGFHSKPPPRCPQCQSTELKELGFGTEKLEEELSILLPDVSIERLDLDNTRRKNAFRRIISRFESGQIDVLIGTQMVTKGLDFDDVTLVGVLSADSLLHFPDFRAHERAYQLMEQVAGRAGRRKERGRVTIQSFKPNHQIINHVLNHDYKAMVKDQLAEREIFNYPPFARLIQIELRHKDKPKLDSAAGVFAAGLRHYLNNRVLGPEYPPVSRLKSVYRKTIMLKLERDLSPQKVKQHIANLHRQIFSQAAHRGVRCIFDVDPY
jgi:primosomal protein N' (replication factor Y)